jgi:hypothetical protein
LTSEAGEGLSLVRNLKDVESRSGWILNPTRKYSPPFSNSRPQIFVQLEEERGKKEKNARGVTIKETQAKEKMKVDGEETEDSWKILRTERRTSLLWALFGACFQAQTMS